MSRTPYTDDNEATQLSFGRYPNFPSSNTYGNETVPSVIDEVPASNAANGILCNEHDYEELPGIKDPPKHEAPIGRVYPRVERRGRMSIDAYNIGRRLRHITKAYKNLMTGSSKTVANNDALPPSFEIVDKNVGNLINAEVDQGSDGETSKLSSLPPTRLNLPYRVSQVACGLHHSVLLSSHGEVYVFGGNQHGQLGLGDFVIRDVPTQVPLNCKIIQIAAGSNHTVLLNTEGQVYTFGNNQRGQLGRAPSSIDYKWNAMPGLVPNLGPQFGRRATWISAFGDHTFIKFDESLINPSTLPSARVIANRRCIVIIPHDQEESFSDSSKEALGRTSRLLVISRSDGSCKSFSDEEQLDLMEFSAVCLDSLYDVLWTYDSLTHTISRHNIIFSEAKIPKKFFNLPTILSSELALPNKAQATINRSTAALNLFCCLNTLICAHQLGWTVQDDEQNQNQVAKVYSKEDFSSVCRFESHGGGVFSYFFKILFMLIQILF